jgi:hypothetical protein
VLKGTRRTSRASLCCCSERRTVLRSSRASQAFRISSGLLFLAFNSARHASCSAKPNLLLSACYVIIEGEALHLHSVYLVVRKRSGWKLCPAFTVLRPYSLPYHLNLLHRPTPILFPPSNQQLWHRDESQWASITSSKSRRDARADRTSCRASPSWFRPEARSVSLDRKRRERTWRMAHLDVASSIGLMATCEGWLVELSGRRRWPKDVTLRALLFFFLATTAGHRLGPFTWPSAPAVRRLLCESSLLSPSTSHPSDSHLLHPLHFSPRTPDYSHDTMPTESISSTTNLLPYSNDPSSRPSSGSFTAMLKARLSPNSKLSPEERAATAQAKTEKDEVRPQRRRAPSLIIRRSHLFRCSISPFRIVGMLH